jgi:hypothetical protein
MIGSMYWFIVEIRREEKKLDEEWAAENGESL